MKKIAIITGASSGMGREMVTQINNILPMIDEIWLIARRADRLQETKKESIIPCVTINGDITTEEFYDDFSKRLDNMDGQVKLLVNAAGFGKIGNVIDIKCSDNSGMIDLNCRALTKITQLVIPYMAKRSRIINFASSAAFLPQPRFAVYSATKSYVLSFSRALGRELKDRQIYVTAVCPGPVRTEFFHIAESGQEKVWYKELFMADCDMVAMKALDDSINRKPVSIYGLPMKMLRIAGSVIPDSLLLKFF